MTARALWELLSVLPNDVLDLRVMIEWDGRRRAASMVLVDPPNNMHGRYPAVTITEADQGESNREIICLVSPRK